MDKDWAVLQGAFLLANKLCDPSSLSAAQKTDWVRVGSPVAEAVREICGPDQNKAHGWKRKTIAVVWLKLLSREAEEDVEAAWRENPLFAALHGLPDLNHSVLLELVRSLDAADVFAHFLLRLSRPQICAELERLTRHVTSSPVREEDVRLFLDVWWEMWRGGDERTAEESAEAAFAQQFARLSSSAASLSPQAAKRLKLEPSDESSLATADVLHVLLRALQDLKDHVSSADLCVRALSVCLDSVYTALLLDREAELPIEEKMHVLSKAVSAKREKTDGDLSSELIREAQTDLRACHTPAQFPCRMEVGEAVQIVTDLAQHWLDLGVLSVNVRCDYSGFRLGQSVQRVLAALEKPGSNGAAKMEAQEPAMNLLRDLSKSLVFPQTTPETEAEIALIIVSNRLDEYQKFATLCAGEKSWALRADQWLACLDQNPAAFQQHDTLVSLASTLMGKLHDVDVTQCRKLMKATADIFSALSLEDKNKALAAMLRSSPRGFFGLPLPPAVTQGFEQELNMAFNCIIQGSGRVSLGNLSTAASLVARVAFQNPEAVLRSCCHSAVFNKGAFSLMAQILQLLPGLTEGGDGAAKEGEENGDGLLCRCLQETLEARAPADGERQQLLMFLTLLMTPVAGEGEERKRRSLLPRDVVNFFVLPNLSAEGHGGFDTELSLQLLHAALCVEDDGGSSPHWVFHCSPFPLLYILAQLLNQALRVWEQPAGGAVWSMDTRELLESVLDVLAQLVGAEVAASPSAWSRPLFWLYHKVEKLDWTIRFHLKPVWREHFKNEVPSALLSVCDLPEQEWSALDLPQYGPGCGLLAWMECCATSDSLRAVMSSRLSLDRRRADHVNMFSKGLLVALTQTLPWCSVAQWARLLATLRELMASARLHVPFSLEYVEHLPLLDLRRFSGDLCLSVLLLRAFQLLCGSSCERWLADEGWAHAARLYAHAVREVMSSVRSKLPLPSSSAPSAETADSTLTWRNTKRSVGESDNPEKLEAEEEEAACGQEVLFVLSQLFCHVQHVQVMMPGGRSEPLFLSSLEILTHYEAVMAAFPDSCSALESDNTRHFFTTITDNLQSEEMKAVLKQKIAQLVSTDAR